jgi:hypothetical protein
MRISDSRYDSERVNLNLARRMVAYEVRTETIAELTGISKYTVKNLFEQYSELAGYKRHRGEAPHQPAFFTRTQLHERETAALAAIELGYDVIRPEGFSGSVSIEFQVERLLTAFDVFRKFWPCSKLSFEHAVLLAKELMRGDTLGLAHCPECTSLMVVDRLAQMREACSYCRKRRR